MPRAKPRGDEVPLADERPFARWLKRKRKSRAANDGQAAEQLRVDKATFSRWASGRTVPHRDQLSRVARWGGVREATVLRLIRMQRPVA